MLKKIIIALGVIVGAFVLVGFMIPSQFRIERNIHIKAQGPQIHRVVGDLKQWPRWAPWQEEDPTIKITSGKASTGIGAHQSWTGDSGSGKLTFTATNPQKGIAYDLIFDEGEYRCKAGMSYRPESDGTAVTWFMEGDNGNNIIGRYFGLFMDGMAGPMFEKGLSKLKTVVEAEKAVEQEAPPTNAGQHITH